MGLSFVGAPMAPNASLDGSWQEMLVDAHARGLQFGRDVIFTWGPWGFLNTNFHLGREAAVPIILWQTAGQFAMAFVLVLLTRQLAAWRRIAFAAALLFFHWLFQDIVYFTLVALVGIVGLMARDLTRARLLLWACVLGFIAQFKFTYFVLSAAAVLAAAACWMGRRSPGKALGICAGYLFAVLAAWAAAGQNPDNLYPYLRRSLEIASGYGDAMGVDETRAEFAWGVAVALACNLFVWRSVGRVRDRGQGRAGLALLAFTLFAMWKESFTRADLVPLGGHLFGFFGLVVVLGTVAGGLFFPDQRGHWFDGSALLSLVALGVFDPAYYRNVGRIEWQRLYGNTLELSRAGTLPTEWQHALELSQAANALPAIKAVVGRGTVDVYNFATGIALLNGLGLSSRPIFQSYSAYTPSLEGWNLRFYESARAPDFLIWTDARVDNRYPGEDDAMLVGVLPSHFEPVMVEKGYWLFRRTSAVESPPVRRRVILARTVALSETIQLPEHLGQVIWLRARVVPTALGRARALFYKPALITLTTTDGSGTGRTWRLLPRVAEAGFMLVPTLDHAEDLVALMRGEFASRVASFRFDAPGDQAKFWSHVEVEASAVPGLPIREIPAKRLQDVGITGRRATSIESTEQVSVIDVPGPATQLPGLRPVAAISSFGRSWTRTSTKPAFLR